MALDPPDRVAALPLRRAEGKPTTVEWRSTVEELKEKFPVFNKGPIPVLVRVIHEEPRPLLIFLIDKVRDSVIKGDIFPTIHFSKAGLHS
jgi:hypothetical protein